MADPGREILAAVYKAMWDSGSDGVVVTNPQGSILYLNPAARQLLGDVVDRPAGAVLAEKFWPARPGTESFLPDQPEPVEVYLDWTEPPTYLAVSSLLLPDAQGGVITWRDVTGHKGLERALEQAQARSGELQRTAEEALTQAETASRAKSNFMAIMSHELRTPMTVILGYTQLLLDNLQALADPDYAAPRLMNIESAGNHLLALINDILDFTKIEVGKLELYPENFYVTHLLENLVAILQPLVRKNHNILEVYQATDLGVMKTDPIRLRYILFTLLSNAAKFTSQGKITLRAIREPGPEGDWLEFQVMDTGIGIGPEQMPYLFQAFNRADDPHVRDYGGVGLALFNSLYFCQTMGGNITVASQLGQGSTFTVRLPAVWQAQRDEEIPE